jgi:hypothetical protein
MRAALDCACEKAARTTDPVGVVPALVLDDRVDQNERGEECGRLKRSQGAILCPSVSRPSDVNDE